MKKEAVVSAAQHRLAIRDEIRLDAWRAVLERTDRIVSGANIRIRLTEPEWAQLKDVPGWTNGEIITFNRKMLLDSIKNSDAVTSVLRLKGLNYHELSHVLFTPRSNETVVRNILRKQSDGKNPFLQYAFNALEDQRIETSFSAMYGPSRRYFEAMVLKYLVEDGTSEAAILLHGRKYLDSKIRVGAQDAFVAKHGQQLFDEFAAVIDSYLVVTYPTNSLMGEQLITRYANLLLDMQQKGDMAQAPKPVIDDQPHQDSHEGAVVNAGAQVGKTDQRDVKAAVKVMMDKAAKADDDQRQKNQQPQGDPTNGGGTDQNADGKDKGDSGQAGQAGSDAGQADSPADSGSGSNDNGAPGTGASDTGTGNKTPGDAIRDLINDAEKGLDAIHDDDDVQDDADAMMDAVRAVENNGDYRVGGDVAQAHGKTQPVERDQRAVRRIQSIVQQIRASAEPEILRQQGAGRVDTRRVLSRSATDVEVFTRYDEGALDDTGLEVVLLMDNSGSMGHVMAQANAAMWCLKRSFDRLDINCTVIVYDTNHQILYRGRERAGGQIPQIGSGGGTDPTTALQQALNIFAKSNEPNKVLITVTDGQWSHVTVDQQNRVMKGMKIAGVTSLLLGLNEACDNYGKHSHDIGFDIEDVSMLPKAVTQLVTAIMRRALHIA